MKRKILYITGSRADYGLMHSTLKKIDSNPNLDLEIIVTGMHIMKEFGMTINEIKKDNFKIHVINCIYKKDNKESMAFFIGDLIKNLVDTINKAKPDILLLLGDRGEMLAGAIVGTYLSIPVAHVHGGEITGNVDESTRHAITKLSNIHFAATEKSARRIIRMGENPKFVFNVGAPGLDDILNNPIIEPGLISDKYGIDFSEPLILVIQHPVTSESNEAPNQILQTLNAIKELKYQSIVIYPNCDAGGRKMIDVIKSYKHDKKIKIFDNIPRSDYLSILKKSSLIIGNSSSAIIEAPSLKVPVINIGSRQQKRERSKYIIDVDCNKESIKKTIKYVLNDIEFKRSMKHLRNPYGDGRSGDRIVRILSEIEINNDLITKQFLD
ncbi:MAG TPA: UDP-N-acetylglucosamine 2-epimerase [Methanofastidiosum sp.]|jgi:UDP-hydrolysing UDP-N-acetyl-D-glucosamine 2-epimerase|nr:UDP-N-acetylglucosamine 2-epimerase [Methanofastidiosum sp.]HOR87620.1 UDP-N-acetylglucosamine 2-epimerase [Methanofastidiosum sp.]HPL01066.1 UDP-N-acetylglucosamine 2-epimerase [Methanofastidiosum sp.]